MNLHTLNVHQCFLSYQRSHNKVFSKKLMGNCSTNTKISFESVFIEFNGRMALTSSFNIDSCCEPGHSIPGTNCLQLLETKCQKHKQ